MDKTTFSKLMKLLHSETIEILGDAAFAVEVVKISRSRTVGLRYWWPLLKHRGDEA